MNCYIWVASLLSGISFLASWPFLPFEQLPKRSISLPSKSHNIQQQWYIPITISHRPISRDFCIGPRAWVLMLGIDLHPWRTIHSSSFESSRFFGAKKDKGLWVQFISMVHDLEITSIPKMLFLERCNIIWFSSTFVNFISPLPTAVSMACGRIFCIEDVEGSEEWRVGLDTWRCGHFDGSKMNPLHVVLDLHTFYDILCCHSAVSLKCAKPHMFIMTGSIFTKSRAFVVGKCSKRQYSQETEAQQAQQFHCLRHCAWMKHSRSNMDLFFVSWAWGWHSLLGISYQQHLVYHLLPNQPSSVFGAVSFWKDLPSISIGHKSFGKGMEVSTIGQRTKPRTFEKRHRSHSDKFDMFGCLGFREMQFLSNTSRCYGYYTVHQNPICKSPFEPLLDLDIAEWRDSDEAVRSCGFGAQRWRLQRWWLGQERS